MQGETGSLHDLKRYHNHVLPRKILEENERFAEESEDDEDENLVSETGLGGEGESEHLLRLREFQVKLLASSNTAYNNRSKSGRRHTLCLTR